MTEPFNIALIVGSASARSRTAALARHVSERLNQQGFRVRIVQVRDLPAQPLLHADTQNEEIAAAAAVVEQADGVIVASPVYKAACSGLVKTFLDLLPQRAFQGKVVLPLLTGGTLAHVLALDYGLRPVLQSLEPRHVVSGLFLLDQWITITKEQSAALTDEAAPRLESIVRGFVDAVRSNGEYR